MPIDGLLEFKVATVSSSNLIIFRCFSSELDELNDIQFNSENGAVCQINS